MRGLPFALLSGLRAAMCRKMAAISVMGARRSCKTVWVQLEGVRTGLRLSSSQMLGLAWSHCTRSEPQRDGLRAVSCFAVISLWLYHYRLAWLASSTSASACLASRASASATSSLHRRQPIFDGYDTRLGLLYRYRSVLQLPMGFVDDFTLRAISSFNSPASRL